LARWVLTLARGQDLTEDDFIDFGSVDLRAAKCRLDRDSSEFMRWGGCESAIKRADGGARRAYDYDFTLHSLGLLDVWQRRARRRYLAI
jgi:hypothetical protein